MLELSQEIQRCRNQDKRHLFSKREDSKKEALMTTAALKSKIQKAQKISLKSVNQSLVSLRMLMEQQ